MKTKDAIKYFGSQAKLARALGINRQSITAWSEDVPIGRAYQIQVITRNKLKAK